MTRMGSRPIALHPRCDGKRVLFEIEDEGRSIACAISMMALEDLCERRCFKPADQMKSFDAVRQWIAAIALGKIRAQAEDVSVLVNIWSNDVEDSGFAGAPAAEPQAKP